MSDAPPPIPPASSDDSTRWQHPAGQGQDPAPQQPAPQQPAPQQPASQQPAPQQPGAYPPPPQYPQAAPYPPAAQYPQAGPSPQAGPYGPAGAYVPPVAATGTNTLSVIALVLGFLVPIGGIIAGFVALGQIRRTGEKGRGLALGGIFVGFGVIVIYVLAIIAIVIAGIATSVGVANEQSSGLGSSGSGSGSGGTDDGTSTSLFVGDCVDEDASQVVDCRTAHDDEVYATSTVSDAVYSEDSVTAQAEDYCSAQFESFVGLSADSSELEYGYYTPTQDTWDTGDRQIACIVDDPAGQTTGTLRGAAR